MSHIAARATLRVTAGNVGTAAASCLVRGLCANTLYRFCHRIGTPQASSSLSQPLALITLPARIGAPTAAASGARWVRLRFYSHKSGAYQYVIEAQALSPGTRVKGIRRPTPPRRRPLSGTGAVAKKVATAPSSGSSSSWVSVWEGRAELAELKGLAPGSKYKVRVVPYNCWGGRGDPSPHSTITTPKVEDEEASKPPQFLHKWDGP